MSVQMNTDKKQIISVVFSFRNEDSVLQELINRVENIFKKLGYDYELIFVNDDSIDKSLEILEKNRKRNNQIKIVNMSRRFGVSACVIAGFEHSIGDAVIYMDSDLQDPPEIIPELIKKWEEGNDVVHTIRTKRKGENVIRMFLVKIAYKVIDSVSDIKIPQNSGNFKLISRRALEGVLKMNDHDPFLRGLSVWVGFRQSSIYYERDPRQAGESHFSLLKSSGLYKDLIRGITAFSSAPLYISLFIGIIVSLGSLIYIIIIVCNKVFFGIENSGWASTMVTMLFLGGVILFAIGIQGVYIGKINEAIKQRPRYLIESKKGFNDNTTKIN